MKIMQIKDLATAIRIYYEKPELTNQDIRELFNSNLSEYMLQKLKKKAGIKMAEKKVPRWSVCTVNTECAYEAWGLNITDLEKRYAKLQKLGMLEAPQNA